MVPEEEQSANAVNIYSAAHYSVINPVNEGLNSWLTSAENNISDHINYVYALFGKIPGIKWTECSIESFLLIQIKLLIIICLENNARFCE